MNDFGARVARVEDQRLLSTGGTFVDDLRNPELTGAARVTFIRAAVAHAELISVDVTRARADPDVVAVYVADDLTDMPKPQPYRRGDYVAGGFVEPLLAGDTVRFVGEPIALILSRTTEGGRRAAALVQVEYRRFSAVVGAENALRDDPVLFPDAGTNLVDEHDRDTFDDAIFDSAEVVVERDVVNQRLACLPLECRAVAAVFDGTRLTVWLSSQNAQRSKDTIAAALGISLSFVRVVVPDVGGGFGAKIGIDRDSILVAWAAWHSRQAVRWAENRSENLLAMTQGRAQVNRVKIGGRHDGTITAYRLDVLQDAGAYPRTSSLTPVTCRMAPGVYDLPYVQSGFRIVTTSTTPINKYRGAGRPEATAAIERAVDLFAMEIGMDPAEVRRVNLIARTAFPFRTLTGVTYDSGDYEAVLEKSLKVADYAALRAEQAAGRARGDAIVLGIGLCLYVEMTGGGSETASVSVDGMGRVNVLTGSSTQGQGHHTAWSVLAHRVLGIPLEQITVAHGDTDLVPRGVGTYSSRSLQLGGSAVHEAAVALRDQAQQNAAELLGCTASEVIWHRNSGTWCNSKNPARRLSWAEVARSAPSGIITAQAEFFGEPTFPFGAHVSVVQVDTDTGMTRAFRHIAVDDAGRVLNPGLAEGQRHGGIAQGIAQALFEGVSYEENGEPLNRTLEDCHPVTAADLPAFELVSSETPTVANPLGVKGVGESGTIGATPAVHNAVIDAVAHLGVRHIDMPLTPQRVLAAITQARQDAERRN